MDSRNKGSQSALALDIFDKFCAANTLTAITAFFSHLCSTLQIKPTNFAEFFPKLKENLTSQDARELLSKYEAISRSKGYERGQACCKSRVLIIGAGPCGLRTAIEAQLLGAKVVLIEKRDRFSRNNVLHLWPFVITDLKRLGAKKFYGKFCAGSIDHISISQIQCILLKVALLVGVEFHEEVSFENLQEPKADCAEGWKATISPADHPVSNYKFDVLIGADGRRNTLEGFKRKALRAKLAIAITANFVNKHTQAEAKVQEISGVSYIFKQDFFQELSETRGIDLENIVYYKDETHYFVMTAKKHSLLYKGVLLEDYMDTDKLLSPENIDLKALRAYALEAANFSTENQLPNLEFALNHYGQQDVAIIDFTAMYASENACRVIQRNGHKLLLGLVGDSLLEPFWPTGSGCARGFLSSLDACWMIRNWSKGRRTPLEVIAERESVFRLLAQTTHENLSKDQNLYTADPHTRYPNLNVHIVKNFQVKSLYESDGSGDFDQEEIKAMNETIENRSKKSKILADDDEELNSPIDANFLTNWIRNQVYCYGVEILEIFDVFVDGDALCALIHRFRPDLIPEFPLPDELQEDIDVFDVAAFRNQLAFDFLDEHYGLPPVVSGFDSIDHVSAHLPRLLSYLSKVYDIFKREIPQRITKKSLINSEQPVCDVKRNRKFQDSNNSDNNNERVPSATSHLPQGNVFRSATLPTFLFGQNPSVAATGKPMRPKVYPTSIKKLVKKLDSGGCSSPCRRSLCISSSEDEEEPTETSTIFGKFPVGKINNELRAKRFREAEKAKLDALQLMENIRVQKAEFQKEALAAKRERVVKAMRQTSLSENGETSPDNNNSSFSTVKNDDDFFNEYNMRLYRQTVPTIEERSKTLENKLLNATGIKMKTTLHGFVKSEPEPLQSLDERNKELNRLRIGKIEKNDWIVQVLEKKISENSNNCAKSESRVPPWSKEPFNPKVRKGVSRSFSERIVPSKPMIPPRKPDRRSPERVLQERQAFLVKENETPVKIQIPLDIPSTIESRKISAGLKSPRIVRKEAIAARMKSRERVSRPPRERSPDPTDNIFAEIDEDELKHLLDWTERNF